ncbi:hypothetical protein EJ05DRAFT_489289 [Pseudovirgaria hyperparasitica]|uniref:Myb-like DNA-binding domain-containing protein n=1 Tax=Pseudovirgaria hyperparasitica TaxID=470096 RepID=A0A6A6W0K6_9PEZI|nr:uncharacterized protein EJ05DRAFT_489289 [Pseudovirgaria hyperparasitica]KAF2754601.1 hypothetical protein EJ05DRAFT_489289 [Pseudovirgaria hyperparasitica]
MAHSGVEQAKFLFLCQQHAVGHKIDYNEVGRILDLKPATANMRMTRLRARVEKGEDPSPENMEFLWTCLTANHDGQMPSFDWKVIGAKMNLKPATAAMRLTRLKAKMGWSKGSAPSTPVKSKSTKVKQSQSKTIAAQSQSKSKRNTKVEADDSTDVEGAADADDTDSADDIAVDVKNRLSATPSRAAKRKIMYAESDASEDKGSNSDVYQPESKKIKRKVSQGPNTEFFDNEHFNEMTLPVGTRSVSNMPTSIFGGPVEVTPLAYDSSVLPSSVLSTFEDANSMEQFDFAWPDMPVSNAFDYGNNGEDDAV